MLTEVEAEVYASELLSKWIADAIIRKLLRRTIVMRDGRAVTGKPEAD